MSDSSRLAHHAVGLHDDRLQVNRSDLHAKSLLRRADGVFEGLGQPLHWLGGQMLQRFGYGFADEVGIIFLIRIIIKCK